MPAISDLVGLAEACEDATLRRRSADVARLVAEVGDLGALVESRSRAESGDCLVDLATVVEEVLAFAVPVGGPSVLLDVAIDRPQVWARPEKLRAAVLAVLGPLLARGEHLSVAVGVVSGAGRTDGPVASLEIRMTGGHLPPDVAMRSVTELVRLTVRATAQPEPLAIELCGSGFQFSSPGVVVTADPTEARIAAAWPLDLG